MVTGAVRETRVERWTLSYDPEPCKALRGSKWPVSMWVCPTEGGTVNVEGLSGENTPEREMEDKPRK